MSGVFYLLMGPSAGCGKTTCERAIGQLSRMKTFISHTTRPMREGEVDGESYYFIDREYFISMDVQGDFAEKNDFPKILPPDQRHWYGLSRAELAEKLSGGDAVTVIEAFGYLQIKDHYDCCVLFFMPPSDEELVRRMYLEGRPEIVISERLAGIPEEMKSIIHADYFIDASLPKEQMIAQARFTVLADRQRRGVLGG